MSASTERRREVILTEVYEKGKVTVRDLSMTLDVSEATVRRDLKSLAGSGQLELVYGGATLPRPSDFSFHSKGMRNIEAKRVIGRLAAELVGNNDQVYVDSGTTCFQMAPHLKRKRGVTVILNSARLATELDSTGLRVIMLGGQYRPDTMDMVGSLTMRTLSNLRGFKAFFGTDGFSMDFGLTASDMESASINGLAVANSSEAILLADHSKFDSPSLNKIIEFDSVTRVVTDRRPSDKWMEFLGGKAVDVICPEDAPDQ
jgi:DeoR/GlpR family transcriptional regulator of sugar metabolism